jgi:cellulose synthase/poly-beta-1,6-N-acetylglucosamine synthase-like glycosyltransferase
MITVEFGTMYAVCHTSRSFAADTAIFGGSNGYWRTPVLRSLRMDPAMLTEDIDVSVRAMLAGHRILHDRSIISTELAPSRFASWFYQRLRWAQGWHQVTLKHSRAIMTSPALTRWQKVYWTYILPWRELYGLLSPQALPILLAAIAVHLWSGRLWHWDLYFAATTALTMVSGAWSALVAHRHMALAETAGRRRDTAAYILLSPLLTLLRNAITLVAWLREARRQRDWITTTRGCALPWETARIVEAQ